MAELFAMVEAPSETALLWVFGRLPRTPFLEFGRGRRFDARGLSLSSLLSSSELDEPSSELDEPSSELESEELESDESASELDSERLLLRRVLSRLPFRWEVCLVLPPERELWVLRWVFCRLVPVPRGLPLRRLLLRPSSSESSSDPEFCVFLLR